MKNLKNTRTKTRTLLFSLCLFILQGCTNMSPLLEEDTSLKKKIGSMLMVGFKGKTPQDEEVIQIKSAIDQGLLGGVILFGHNVENPNQLKPLIHSLKEGAPGRLLVAVDQEGGKATRLTPDKNFKVFPLAPQDVAAILSPAKAEKWYGKTSKVLKEMGINVNFGGIADINPPTYLCPVIGDKERSYGTDPQKIFLYNRSGIRAYKKDGIAYGIKHYPGHGYAKGDSHEGFVDITETAQPKEKALFLRIAQQLKPDMIMTAHVSHRNVDPQYPATLSQAHLKPLREVYKGVIVSDDLHMGAIQEKYGLEVAIEQAIKAGCDLLVFSNNPLAAPNMEGFEGDPDLPEKFVSIVMRLIEEGKVDRQKIEDSYLRIQKLFS